MKISRHILFLVFILRSGWLDAQPRDSGNLAFDLDWRFFKGGVERGQADYVDDSEWRRVDLPHDWSIEDIGSTGSPFDSNAISQIGGGFTTGGTAWYRKHFLVPAKDKGRIIQILFDGVYMNADIWLNGVHLGNHPYGYTSFQFDLTPYILFGQENLLAVQVKNEGQNSRWYSGSGINRHVWLQNLDPVHLVQWGTQIQTPGPTENDALITMRSGIENQGSGLQTVELISRILAPDGKMLASRTKTLQLKPGQSLTDSGSVNISHPRRWSTETPLLYSLELELRQQDRVLQTREIPFGIRSMQVDAEHGFMLNGKPLKLMGGCYHNDNGPLGSRAYDRAEERRVELMKASGFNAIRCSHNPPPPAFLDACDRLGMLVIDEAFDMWRDPKTPYDYHLYFDEWWERDLQSMIYRDRNHPSVIMWSIGNEIPNRDKPAVVEVARQLAAEVRILDPGRPVTAAVNDVKEDKDPFFAALDVAGYNYANTKYEPDHQRLPHRIMMGTESYALEAFDYWMEVLDHPYVIGDFIWTGFDYIGEASIGWRGYEQEKSFYPWNLAYCGDIDICGWKRPQSYYRDALWKTDQLSLFVHPPTPSFPLNPRREDWSKWNWEDVVADWNWPGYENKPLAVSVYSSCESVELFINGKSLGRKPTGRRNRFMASWALPWQYGELRAVGYRNKKKVNQAVLRSAGDPATIAMMPDRLSVHARRQDLCYVTVELQDQNHQLNPKAARLIRFRVDGPAVIAGVGNANPVSVESYQLPLRHTWRGKCLVILKTSGAPGSVVLHAVAEGLPEATVSIGAIEE